MAALIVRCSPQQGGASSPTLRGSVHDGELCEITGLGPIPVAHAVLLTDATWKLVITCGVDVAQVTTFAWAFVSAWIT